MVCSKCGNIVPDGTQVCNYCGSSMMQNFNNQMIQNNIGLTKKQKGIIISLLSLVFILLIIVTFYIVKDDKVVTLDDGSRTIMIYMVGSDLEADSKIATSEIENINPDDIDLDKTNVLLYTGGTEKWHNFIKNDENAIYQLKEDGFEKLEVYDKKNMGDYNTLLSFLNYGYDKYESQYYDLILYNHGGAIQGAIYDDFTNDNLSLEEFGKALKESPFNEKNKLNTVLFRTCLNGTIEVASVFAPYAKYMIASEEITNGKTGESVLNFINNISSDDDGIEYGKKFIIAYEDQMENIDPLGFASVPMYSIIDLSKIREVNELLDDFISGIDLKKNYNNIVRVRSNMYQYGYTSFNESVYDTVDLYTLVSNLSKYSDKDSEKLLKKIDEAIIYNWSDEKESRGLSVYFPYNGKPAYQQKFLNVYKGLDTNNTYFKFIGQFNSFSTSKEMTSFSKSDLTQNQISIDKNKEFSLKLTDEQARDYADSIYIVFRKKEDNTFNPIYSSDNTILTESGELKSNISNNLIKLYDKSDQNDDGEYLTLVERGSDNNRLLTTGAVLHSFSGDGIADWKTEASTVYFEIKDGVPNISKYVKINSEKGASVTILNPEDYTDIEFVSSNYKILDEKGNYTPDWDNNGIISGYGLEMKNIGLKLSSLDDNEDYYCVFKIRDIYGNVYYSKLLSIK